MSTNVPRERGIQFSAPMVRALLAGTKTQTRRQMQISQRTTDLAACLAPADAARTRPDAAAGLCPHGQPGDRLWVREAWRMPSDFDANSGSQVAQMCAAAGHGTPWAPVQYEADGARVHWPRHGAAPHDGPPAAGRYRHARFMPRWASRVTLEITGVRAERLQAISEADALAEGVTITDRGQLGDGAGADHWPAIRAYRELWEQINGAGSWAANPWVWVVEFRRADAPAGAA